MTSKFSIGQRVKIKAENPGDLKRVPPYIKGKIGVVQVARGKFHNPRDHRDERPPIYSVLFRHDELFPSSGGSDTIIVDVFEDWMMPAKGE
jgi:nitrile hydratase